MRRRVAPGVVILAYHRVAEPTTDARLLSVTPGHFREHLEVLRRHSVPVRLSELSKVLESRRPFRRAVVVTFDDGYVDNLHVAKPLLERFDVPATVFVTTGYVGSRRRLWGDVLEDVLLRPGTLPPVLRLSIGGVVYEWRLDGAACYPEDAFVRARTWTVLQGTYPGPRQRVFHALHELLRCQPDFARRRAADALQTWAGGRAGAYDGTSSRVMSEEELVRLTADGLVEVGAHTVTHPVLATLSEARQRAEIRRSKQRLEAICGRRVTSFAYPYGSLVDYSPRTVALVREAGFERACSFFEGLVHRRTDPYQLPRCGVGDWDGDQFARRLRTWLRT
jgi:peptidoglycan/xylan/chitin deacetylase (PgdA/CDA1 family)